MSKPILLPKTDVVFKLLFGNERKITILRDFLQAVLNFDDSELAAIKIIDPQLKREHPEDKLGILDVKLETVSGARIDIEIQVLNIPEMRQRVSYYLANLITEQMGGGIPYDALKRAICIVIVDFPLLKESEQYHTVFRMLEQQEHFPFNDLMEIDVLDLTRIPAAESDRLTNWMRFIRAERKEDFEMAANTSPLIREAYAYLAELSEDEENRLLAEARLKAQRDEYSRVTGARKEGLEQGLEQGTARLVRNMSRRGLDAAAIADFTDLTLAQVEGYLTT
ncbi:MAG: Rpn family recombination-promoting nuclease/putative transposase [Oscillospiraceae bacterium]|jgi:predicted transposase/invertase (TIGR01784 family)|nr:Rpn family recombination-promoting nuclease/putative transposase [Oscillospiraceae bacterium]